MTSISPLAPARFPELLKIDGVRFATAQAGIKYQGRTDLFLAAFEEKVAVAGVLTQSKTRSAPVDWCRDVLSSGMAGAILVNSGNANAFTGKAGMLSTEKMAQAAADNLNISAKDVLIASTGVIGENLPYDKVENAMPAMVQELEVPNWYEAASAIMTTDTFPKGSCRAIKIGDTEVKISGIAKGSGMIAPDMATMLSFIFTDAAIPAEILQQLLVGATNKSFNCMTVDGDTSTSDTCILAATAKANNSLPQSVDDPILDDFKDGLTEVMVDLAQQIAKDGEGASKFITIDVTGAQTDASAKIIALAIANSPLVKTAVAGEDANWGRVVMAVGKAGEPADRDALTISMGGVVIAEKGEGVVGYDEAPVAAHLKGDNIHIGVDLALGEGTAQVWTCDLTHGYITINADYRS